MFLFAALLPFYALFSGFVLLALDEPAAFAGVVLAVLAGSALWGALLLWLDRRQLRPLKSVKRKRGDKRWLRAGAVEAPDVRRERLAIERNEVDADTLAIRIRGAKRRFSGDVIAVRGVTCGVARGECFGLLGPNGAGCD